MSGIYSNPCYTSDGFKSIEDVKAQLNVLEHEFTYRVKHDFRRYLFLGVKRDKAVSLQDVLEEELKHEGYEKHKVIVYHDRSGERILHLYLKYKTCADVLAVQQKYRGKEWNLHAEVVADLLKAWYSYETLWGKCEETLGVLDIVGNAEFSNPLSAELAYRVLIPFGEFRIVNVEKTKVDVSFNSMAEGIAACIALGKWFIKSDSQDQKFHYRVLLNKSNNFAQLVNKCNNDNKAMEAFNLDYFVPSEAALKNPEKIASSEINTKTDSEEPPAAIKSTKKDKDYLRVHNKGFKCYVRNPGQRQVRNFKQFSNYEYKNMPVRHYSGACTNNLKFPNPNVNYFQSSRQ